MGWLPSIFGGNAEAGDPFSQLDPKLREFLDKESPVKYQTKKTTSPTPSASDKGQGATTNGKAESSKPDAKAADPVPTLYKDGRYAHLWKDYRPLAEIEAESASDHDKLQDVLDGYKHRRRMIAKTALYNCAFQQMEWRDCMNFGSVEDKAVMCRDQVRRFDRCLTVQQRFLKALGYLSDPNRDPIVDEDIQMHADAMFNRVLDHEKAVLKAKQEGLPLPIFDAKLPLKTDGSSQPSHELRKKWKERLDRLPEEERAAEEVALRVKLQEKRQLHKNLEELLETTRKERQERQAAGQGTIGDTISALFGR